MTIHSFHDVLRARRSMHSFEILPGHRIPLPRPITYVNALYFFGVLLVMLVVGKVVPLVEIVGAPLHVVAGDASIAAWVCVYVIVPAAIVWLADNAEVDGRAPHRWVVSFARYYRRPKRTLAGMPIRREGARTVCRGHVRFWWDLATPRLHHGWIKGGRVSSRVPVRFTHAVRHKQPVFAPHDEGEVVFGYEVSDRLEVRQ
jgi:hypothetical protein